METKLTQRNILTGDKKTWEIPTLVVIDSNTVNGGPVNSIAEKTASGLPTPTNHS
jgi:hypothetical protein